MTWPTLRGVQMATRLEGKRSIAMHHFVRCVSGRWCRTLGIPDSRPQSYDGVHMAAIKHVRGRVWHMEKIS